MKKLYLVEKNDIREFWTIDDENVFRYYYGYESAEAENCDGVEDDTDWIAVELMTSEIERLFDDVKVIDERDFN